MNAKIIPYNFLDEALFLVASVDVKSANLKGGKWVEYD